MNEPESKNSRVLKLEISQIRSTLIWVLFAVGVFLILDWAFITLQGLIFTIILAWLFSVAIEPAVSFLESKKWRRGLATFTVLIAILVSIVSFGAVFGQMLFSQAASFVNTAPEIVTSVTQWLNANLKTSIDADELINSLNLTSSSASDLAASLAGGVLGFISTILSFLINLLSFVLFLFYFSADAPKVRRTIARALPPKQQEIFIQVWKIASEKAGGFVITRVILALICVLTSGVFFYIVDLTYWLPLALFTGIISQFIPTIGTYIGIGLPAIVALSQSPGLALAIAIFGVAYQQLENFLFSPKLSSRALNIHPAVAFAAVLAGGTLFGAMGAFVAIPVMAIIVAIVDTYLHRYELVHD